MAAVLAGEERPAGGRTGRAAGIKLREAHPLRRHPVQVRRWNFLLAVAPEIAPAQVIGEDDEDVRMRLVRDRLLCRRPPCPEKPA
jgi:hypothetical protein